MCNVHNNHMLISLCCVNNMEESF
uniref:Uncharacterized protein n=1 Tax=Physcomitrium patens TaxID=3218 RepID=A0A2K1IYM5_PHYPA|nr:hypothetical protein PHYPA_024199 [Physcomitrium patens]